MFFSKKPKDPVMIVGLGNPGGQYQNTRHNVGFRAIDAIEPLMQNAKSSKKMKAEIVSGSIEGQNVLLVRPQTYMNESGQAVGAISRYYNIPSDRIIVIFDDISLEPGRLRIRAKGSAGGHNGVKSVIEHLQGDGFVHVKIGVGAKPHPDYDLVRWVLGNLHDEAKTAVEEVLKEMPDLVKALLTQDIPSVMNRFNR